MATNLLKGGTVIGARLLLPFSHPHFPLNFPQINSATNLNHHRFLIRNKKPKSISTAATSLSSSAVFWPRRRSSSPFCTASSAADATTSDSVVGAEAPANDVVVDQGKIIKDAADVLDIRVGRITKAWRHEEADSLYVEEVDIGEAEPRTICSGLVKYVPLDHLQDRNVVVLANLKPRNMRGVKSSGMLMAASDASHENVELLVPPEGSLPGQRIWFGSEDDHQNQPPAASPNQIQKKKIWELVQPHLKTDDACIAMLGEHVMRASAGVVISSSLRNANIS